jgi:hypothetical protein
MNRGLSAHPQVGWSWVAIALVALGGPAQAQLVIRPALPDLVVSTLVTTGPARLNPFAGGRAELPIQVIVKNQGTAPAGLFRVDLEYASSVGTFWVPFVVPGQPAEVGFPRTTAVLPAGSAVTFDGTVIFHPSVHGLWVRLQATADSCAGVEFAPWYCAVLESDENNNRSAPLAVFLP